MAIRAAIAALLASGVIASAQTVTLVDNLSEPIRSRTDVHYFLEDSLWASQSFVPDTNYTLDNIDVILSDAAGGSVYYAAVHTGTLTEPTTSLSTLTMVPGLPTGPDEIVTLLPDQPVALLAGETYWLVLGVEFGGLYYFSYADTNNWTGPGAIANYAYSFDAGSFWSSYGSDFPHQLRVLATPDVCYADCDGNGSLNIFDYICFGNAYAAQQAYADCDGNGSFNIFDYICFGNLYAAGCP